jgi:hypothetical protein
MNASFLWDPNSFDIHFVYGMALMRKLALLVILMAVAAHGTALGGDTDTQPLGEKVQASVLDRARALAEGQTAQDQRCPPPTHICECGPSFYKCCNSDEKCVCAGGSPGFPQCAH